MNRSDIPTIVQPHKGTTSTLAPGTTGVAREEREPYSARQARRDQQRQLELQAQREAQGGAQNAWSNDLGENPYLSHLRPRAAGYAGSEVSSSSIGGTSMGGGSSVQSSYVGGNHSHSSGYSRSVSGSIGAGVGAGPSGRIIYTPDDRRPGSTTGSQSMSPPLLSPIPQRRISPTSFILNKDDRDDHTARSASRTNNGAGVSERKGGSFLTIPPGGSTSHSTTSRKRRSAKSASTDVDSPFRRWVRYLNMELGLSSGSTVAVCLGLVAGLKWLIGLGGYSGRADHPRKGDFEAQRFWMDLTVNEKWGVRWYAVGGVGDGDWWRLDYPPLTAYISWVFGKIGQALLPSSFAGHSSRGNEFAALTIYMRWTVLALESISWWPIVVFWCWSGWGVGARSKRTRMVTILSILLQPSLILIDNGHFQYNSFPIAMTLLSVYLFQSDRDLLGAVAFSASLLFKQMGLYWSPAVFGYLLGKCVWIGGEKGLILFVKIGVTTASTFLLAFLPFLRPFPSALLVLLGRIFPLQRGIFEDKVANFWCASNVVFKWNNWFETGSMAKLATLATLLAITPTLAILLWTSYRLRRPVAPQSTPPGLPPTAPLIPLVLFTSSMAFFLFSFQVHEKSILVPLLSVYMLLGEKGEGKGTVWDGAVGLLNVATYSMYPLLKRDDQTLQYVVWTLGWNYLVGYNPIKVVNLKLRWIGYLVYTFIIVHHLFEAFVTPPTRYPDIYPVTNTLLSFSIFGLTWLIASWKLLEMAVGMVGLGGFGSTSGRLGQDQRVNRDKTK